jgi:hypothetical protein
MKKFILVFSILTLAAGAKADVINCGVDIFPGRTDMIKLDQQNLEAVILEAEFSLPEYPVKWYMVHKDAKIIKLPNTSDPMLVVRGDDKSKTDWSKIKECYRFRVATFLFNIDTSKTPMTGTLEHIPNMDIKPDVHCHLPEIREVPPFKITCQYQD